MSFINLCKLSLIPKFGLYCKELLFSIQTLLCYCLPFDIYEDCILDIRETPKYFISDARHKSLVYICKT